LSTEEKVFLPTEIQVEILEYVARGASNKVIASKTHRSVAAVEYHVHRLFEQTGCSNRVELALWWQDYRRSNPFDRYRTAG
jgi:DNA-binding NarL/FixJ family response regulator